MSKPLNRDLARGVAVVHASPQEVFQVISDAASQDLAKISSSTERLKELLDMTGTSAALSEIAVQETVPLPVRQQAIIQLKNNVSGHWKSRRVLPEQRERIRNNCLLLLNEPDDLICECNKLVTAKIARYDYPNQWPNVLPDLINVINTNLTARYNGLSHSFLNTRRALELVNAILKEGLAQKMLTGVKTMSQMVEQLHPIMQSHYSTIAPSLVSVTPESILQPSTAENLLLAHLIYKCLAKGAIFMYQRIKTPEAESWLNNLVQSSILQLKALSELRINLALTLQSQNRLNEPILKQYVTALYRHVYVFGKLFRRLQQLDSARFVQLPLCSDLVYYYWSKVVQAADSPKGYIEDVPTAVFPVRFLVQSMVVFKDSVVKWAPVRKDGTQNEQVLHRQFVEDAVKLLVTRFIPLQPADLEVWMADPESWVNAEESENDQWEYGLRPCAERVLMVLASQCGLYVQPLLLQTWKEMRGLSAVGIETILHKEALYCAIGRCAFPLREAIPFEEWLQTNLIPEAHGTDPSYPILKRRIAWLIGKWISSECSSPNNPSVWEVLVHLLRDRGPGTDAVVQLTAAMAIRECIDTLQFDLNVFRPYISPVVTELLRLIAEIDASENKRRLVNCLNTVVERAELDIVPFMGLIVEPLPQFWTAAEDDWLFKATLLDTVAKLCNSSKQHSAQLCVLVVPMVQQSFTEAAKTQLEEDALELWQTALRQTTTIEPVNGQVGLIELLPLAISLLSNLDIVGKVILLLESYILLDPLRVLQIHAMDLFNILLFGLKEAITFNQKHILQAIHLLFQLVSPQLYAEALHRSGMFAFIVKALDDDKAQTDILTEYIYLLARIAIADKQIFVQLVSATPSVIGLTESKAWEAVMNQWWTRFDNMSEPRYRKLTAMGVANLVSTGRPEVLDRLSNEICNLWLDVFGEVKEAQERSEDESDSLTLYWDKSPEQLFEDFEGTVEFDRRKATYENDPVRTTQLTSYVGARIHEAEVACGGGMVLQSQYLAKADPTVLQQIQQALEGRY